MRAYIVRLTDTELHLHLSYKQRNRDFFSKETTYAIEKDSTDSGMQSARRGLFALLTAPKERRALLLCQRLPRFDTSIKLSGNYGARTNAIVLPAMQAQDFYLLVGPPGTGKTNVALRSMVQEFLTAACLRGERPNLLLAAYTNRAGAPYICGGRYGLSSKDTTPAQIKAVYDHLLEEKPFTGLEFINPVLDFPESV